MDAREKAREAAWRELHDWPLSGSMPAERTAAAMFDAGWDAARVEGTTEDKRMLVAGAPSTRGEAQADELDRLHQRGWTGGAVAGTAPTSYAIHDDAEIADHKPVITPAAGSQDERLRRMEDALIFVADVNDGLLPRDAKQAAVRTMTLMRERACAALSSPVQPADDHEFKERLGRAVERNREALDLLAPNDVREG